MAGSAGPPSSRLTVYEYSKDFPPRSICKDKDAVEKWFADVFAAGPLMSPDPTMTERERTMYLWTAAEYIGRRRDGKVTCEEFAAALVKRALYCRRYNQWVYTSYGRFDKLVEDARALDARAAAEGVEAIAPLYGLPVPMKGTAAVVDYPSGSGSGVLSGYTPVKDSAHTQLIKQRNGLIFGCTNVPEFAASYTTANPASGITRNPYNPRFTVAGSSGGSASAVANYNCPIAVTEDTGGSTRAPASCNQNFGFDPSRNHYCNDGNPGLSYTNDQLGWNARTLEDIILLDELLLGTAEAHAHARQEADMRSSIRVVAPLVPFVEAPSTPGLFDPAGFLGKTIEPQLKAKREAVLAALQDANFDVLRAEWPTRRFPYLGREENVALESLFSGELVNGKPLPRTGWSPQLMTATGQLSTFVTEYLDAPVSAKEIIADFGSFPDHDPSWLFMRSGDETQFRYFLGPHLAKEVAAYNAIFDVHRADLLLIPSMRMATPDYADLVAGRVFPGGPFNFHQFAWKHLHIPKLVVPTGLTADGRPSAVQLFGRALPVEEMYSDSAAVAHDAQFLHLARRAAAAIQAVPALARADAESVKHLWTAAQ